LKLTMYLLLLESKIHNTIDSIGRDYLIKARIFIYSGRTSQNF